MPTSDSCRAFAGNVMDSAVRHPSKRDGRRILQGRPSQHFKEVVPTLFTVGISFGDRYRQRARLFRRCLPRSTHFSAAILSLSPLTYTHPRLLNLDWLSCWAPWSLTTQTNG